MNREFDSLRVVGIGGTLRHGSTSLIALERTLQAAEQAGATTELIDLNTLRLPLFEPDYDLADYSSEVQAFIATARRADAMIWSTAAYHGTLAGVTKNALDYFQFLADDIRPYLDQRVVGLIATAGGDQAAINAINALVHTVHSLRGIAVPLSVPISNARRVFEHGALVDERIAARLDQLGQLVVATAEKFQPRAIALGA
jgi:FMN reductase